MAAAPASDIISVWERGARLRPVDRALVLLAAACPGLDAEQLASMSVGRRDERLLRLRERILGPAATAEADCPRCGEALEFTVRTAELTADGLGEAQESYEIETGDFRLRFRLPDSRDLNAVAGCGDVERARRLLVERCVDAGGEALQEEAAARIASLMAERDPMADIAFALDCAVCGHAWSVALDIAGFLWLEIAVLARRLLGEVHTLALAYGWSEAEILAMSDSRRNHYLEMAS